MCDTHCVGHFLYGLSSMLMYLISIFVEQISNLSIFYCFEAFTISQKQPKKEKSIAHSFAIHTFSIPPNTGRHLKNLIPQVHTVSVYMYLYTRAATRHPKHILYNGRLSKYKQNKKSQCWIILFIFLRIRKYIFFVRFFSARPIPGKAACLVNMG